eukprot:gene8964-9139_t
MVEPSGKLSLPKKRNQDCKQDVLKYKAYSRDADPLLLAKWRPSQLVADLQKPLIHAEGWRPKPQVVQLLNIAENTHQVQSTVDIDQPLFQPAPSEIVFHSYKPFQQYEAQLRLRNNDKVARRVTVQSLDSSCFSVQRLYMAGQVEGSKVAAGMEAIYNVTFKPESIDSYEQQLVVKTEREQFLVPLLAVGAAAALDLADSITLPASPVHRPVRQSLLVSNVGTRAGKFHLATSSSCFTVSPTSGQLAPCETLQLLLEFTPSEVGEHDAELEVLYEESGRATFSKLKGTGVALPVGLSDSVVAFMPTYMSKLSHRNFKVVNNSDASIQFSIQANSSTQADLAATCSSLITAQHSAVPLTGTISLSTADAAAGTEDTKVASAGFSVPRAVMQLKNQQGQLQLNEASSLLSSASAPAVNDSEAADELLLQDKQLAEVRRTKRTRRAIATDKQLFSNQYFAVFPAEGAVNPHSELEVMVQFAPDSAREFEAVAWVQLQGAAERLPVKLSGQGLGAQVVFSYDVLDIGEAFVNTQHQYDVELLNKGKVEAQWSLQPCNTRFGSKFTFSPETGALSAGATQNIRVQLLSDCLGQLSESFQLQLKGSWTPLLLRIKGEVVGPQFTLDSQMIDFGIVSYGFRYHQEILLSNAGAIPLPFQWHVANELDPGAKEVTILPVKGIVLPYASQTVRVEFRPQAVQKYSLQLVMDMPGVADAAASLPITAECAVPLISLAQDDKLLHFGEVFLRHPYSRDFSLVNQSKLPAKFEVLAQDQQSQCLGLVTAAPAAATIPAKGLCTVSLSLQAFRLGRMQLPVFVRVAGSRNQPLQLIAEARGVGPSLQFAVAPPGPDSTAAAAAAAGTKPAAASTAGASNNPDNMASVGVDTAICFAPVEADSAAGDKAALSLLAAEPSVVSHSGSTSGARSRSRAGVGSQPRSLARAGQQHVLEWTDGASINFKNVQVLQPHTQELRLRNATPIAAEAKLFVEGQDSVFEVEPREAVIPAGGELPVLVRVLLDDTVTFKDVLHVLVTEGADVNIPLEAMGTGSTLVCDVLSGSKLDFGCQFVGRGWQLEVVVANMSRRAASLVWSNTKLEELLKAYSKKTRGTGKKFEASDLPADKQPVFSITPDKALLGPKESTNFMICGLSSSPGFIAEQLQCQSGGSGGKNDNNNKPKLVYDIEATAEVAAPLLELSKRAVEFVYNHVIGATPATLTDIIEARNVSKLPVKFTMKVLCPGLISPFTIEPTAASLQPGEVVLLTVSFDPNYKHDLMSQVVQHRCLMSHPDNPQKDWLELNGIIQFPNLTFSTTSVDFGCVLMDSMRRVSVDMTNPGSVPVEYCWSWVKTPALEEAQAAGDEVQGAPRPVSSKAVQPALSQLFDILPIRGVLPPGHTEQVEFSFYAYPGVKANAVAACQVVDGPMYQVTLTGESNSIKYEVTPQFFDCGLQPYDRAVERDLHISNTGKVAFDFSIDLSHLSRPGVMEVSAMTGKVAAGEKAHIKLKVKSKVPARLMELVLVSIAHYEPVQVQVLVEGSYPVLALSLPRVKDDAFVTALQQCQSSDADAGLPVTVRPALNLLHTGGSASMRRVTSNFTSVPRGSVGSGSITAGSVAGQGGLLGAARAGGSAKSQVSGMSSASVAKSRASMAANSGMGSALAKDKLAQLMAALAPEKRLEFEAERLRLVQQLLSVVGNSATAGANAASEAHSGRGTATNTRANSRGRNSLEPAVAGVTTATSTEPNSSTEPGSTGSVASTSQRRPGVAPKLPDLVSGHYLLDFGCVTKGTSKSRKVKLTNMSSQQVAFVVDKQTLESFGFSMIPEAAVKLAGAPDCQTLEVAFTMMAAKPWVLPGPVELTLPLLIKGGPAVLLTLRALVVVPEVLATTTLLDFGEVSTGHCKVFSLQLHNPREVPAEWSIKRPAVDSPKLRDWGFFVPQPAEGVLEPGESVVVKVTFTPVLNRELPYSLQLPIKVANNPKARELMCSGRGYTPRVEFSPTVLDCGAILPKVPGQRPAEAIVQLRNLGHRPVEVVSLDLNSQYLADEEALRSLDIYGDSGCALLRPLDLGEPMWPELLELAAQRQQLMTAAEAAVMVAKQALAAAQASRMDEVTLGQSAEVTPPTSLAEPAGLATTIATPAETATAVESSQLPLGAPVPQPERLIIMLYGPPAAPTTTQAALLGTRYGIPIVTLDGLLKEVYMQGVASLSSLDGGSVPGSGGSSSPAYLADSMPVGLELHKQLSRLLASPAAAPEAGPDITIAVDKRAQSATGLTRNRKTQEQAPQQQQLPSPLEAQDIVLMALKHALSLPQYQAGFVLDGFGSKHLPVTAMTARCMLQAVGLTCINLPPAESISTAGSTAATSKAKQQGKTSRPSSSRAGIRPVPQLQGLIDITQPDVWEGTQKVHVVELALDKEEAALRFAAAAAFTAAGLESITTSAEHELPVEPSFAEAQQAKHEYSAAAVVDKVDAAAPEAMVSQAAVGISFNADRVGTVLPPVPADQLLLPPPYELRVLPQPQRRGKRRPLTNFTVWTMLPLEGEAASKSGDDVAASSLADRHSPSPVGEQTSHSRPLSSRSGAGEAGAASGVITKANTPRVKNGKEVVSSSKSVAAEPASVTAASEADMDRHGLQDKTRWIVPPHGTVRLLVQFSSETVGKWSEVLGFDVICGQHNEKVTVLGMCDYPHISTEARNMFYRLAKARPPTPQVRQQFMLPSSVFEFGPLLVGKDRLGCLDGAHPDHTAKFRITNNGLFPLHAEFWLKSEGTSPQDPAAQDAKKKQAMLAKPAGTGSKAAPSAATFLLHPSTMDLLVDETQELTVCAFPSSEGPCEDVVLCRIKDNPTLLEFPINVVGAKPSVTVKLNRPEGAAAGAEAAEPSTGKERRSSQVGAAKAVKPGAAKGKVAPELTVQFDKLLLNRKDVQSFFISNTSVLPFKWRLAGASALPPEFKVSPSAGELAARSDVRVTVEFTAVRKQELAEVVTLEVLDLREALGISRAIPIAIKGEAYDIHVDIKFPQDSFAGVDFGPLRVVDDCVKQLVLKNTERYDVKFSFAVRSNLVKSLVTISPEDGCVQAEKEVAVKVHWNQNLTLREEIAFASNTDILLSLTEPATEVREQQVPIKLSARAMFSHYAITPAHGLHFGPVTYNTVSKPRCFEVVNLGEFPFKMHCFSMSAKPNSAATVAASPERAVLEEPPNPAKGGKVTSGGRKPPAAANGLGQVAGALQLGQFTLDPADAIVQPGCRQEVSVVFRAEGNKSWTATAGLDISERDFTDHLQGIPYELGGESCVPGIDVSSIGSMFEESVVVSHMDPFIPVSNSFGLKDKVYNFGTVLAQLPDAASAAAAAPGADAPSVTSGRERKSVVSKATGAAGKRVGSAGKAVAGAGPASAAATAGDWNQPTLLEEPGAVKTNMKFTNPFKVPCTVKFTIKPRGGHQSGVTLPMEVHPSSIVLPPHEYRHITLAFCPRAIQQYSATFEAMVQDGAADLASSGFVCELRGEGTLPSLSLQEPSTLDAAGRPVLKFGKLMAGRSSTLLVNVRNNGLLPASAKIEMSQHPSFALLEGPQVFKVDSKKAATFTVKFTPIEVGSFTHELQLRVKQNPFEQYRVLITGECYQEDILFGGLPDNSLDTLVLPDVYLPPSAQGSRPFSGKAKADIAMPNAGTGTGASPGAAAAAGSHRPQVVAAATITALDSSSFQFTLVNNSTSRHFRFKWPEHPQLKFSPSTGHLHAGGVKSMTVTFASAVPLKLDSQEIKLAVSQITYKGEPVEWDDVLALSQVAAGARAATGTARAAPGLPGTGPKPGAEPAVDVVPKTQRELALKVSAVADTPGYECDAPSPAIQFKPTMMFQGRSFTFNLSNPALTALEYRWKVLDKQGNPDTTGLYELSPESGVLAGGASQQVVLRFRPQEVEDVTRMIMCDMPVALKMLAGTKAAAASAGAVAAVGGRGDGAATTAAWDPLVREVSGKVLRPWCHFELPDSDYISAGRRNPELSGPSGVVEPLHPATKVLEFDSLGVRVCNTMRFFVLNPTSITYDFAWLPMLSPAAAALGGPPLPSPFSCVVRKGTIAGGSQGIVVPFLLVGRVSEPRVSLDRPAINFGQVQLGVSGKLAVSLANDEHLPFSFVLDKASYDASDALLAAAGIRPILDIQPVSGVVPANSKVDLCALFTPQMERPMNYNVVVRVRNKPLPLVLNVKGEGYALSAAMLLELPDEGSLEMSPAGQNILDFGQVVINDRVVRSFSLTNMGQVNFDYVWAVGASPLITVKPQSGSVPKGERRVVEVSFAPTTPDKLTDYQVSCQIINGPKYQLLLRGSGYKPKLHCSFMQHDFGPCHIFQVGMTPTNTTLVLRNDDKQALSFDVAFDSTENWEISASPCVLGPGQTQEILVTFKPTAAQTYTTVMPLRVNGLYNINIMLGGEGVPLRIELLKPEQQQRGIAFGAVPCGSSCSRTLSLVNRGRASAFVSFGPSTELFERLGIDIMPAGGVSLQPRETVEVNLWFRPRQRMRPFKEPLYALVAGVSQQLALLTGACTGLSLLLASDSVPFGTVVLGSRTTKRLQLSNVGDVGCRFAWDTAPLRQEFSISPAEGFLAAGQDVKLEVSFHPTAVTPDIRVERLQASTSKSIPLHNPSSSSWQLRPVIQNDFWSGAELLQIPAGASAEYQLVYKPLTMTPSETAPHVGSVFIPIPDGTGLLYKLYGQADQPTPEAVVELSLPAKTHHHQMLKVTNWLHKPQRFRVIKEMLSGEASTRLEGATAIDVPALCDREYKLGLYSYTQGLTEARVTFRAEGTGEYTYYELRLNSSIPEPVGLLVLECPVRSQTSTTISVTNPLAAPVTLKPNISSKQVSLRPEAPVLAAGSSTTLEVCFRPLLVGTSDALLRLDSQELGQYEWKMKLTGVPTNPERSLAFNVPLGSRDTQVFRFMHWLPEKAEYKCSFRGSNNSTAGGVVSCTQGFDAPAVITAPAAGPNGVEVECAVGFEPCAFGEAVRGTLVIASSSAGAYEVPLMGQCVPPKPLGPIDLSKGPVGVPFRNVFNVEAEYVYSIDNPAFVVGKLSEKLAPKKPVSISINYRPEPGAVPKTGKLTQLAHTVLHLSEDSESLVMQPYGSVISCNTLSGSLGGAAAASSLVATSYVPGVLHFIKAAHEMQDSPSSSAVPAAAASYSLVAKGMPFRHAVLSCSFPDGSFSSPLAAVRAHSRVLSLAWLPPSEQRLDLAGDSLLAVLHEFSPSLQPAVQHVDVLAVDWLRGCVKAGPWSIRHLVLCGKTPSSEQPYQRCAKLGRSLREGKQMTEASSSSAAAAASMPGSYEVVKQQLARWSLRGFPLSCASVTPEAFVMGSDSTDLYIVKLTSASPGGVQAQLQLLVANSCLTVPDVLTLVPLMDQRQQQQQQQQGDLSLLGGSEYDADSVMQADASAAEARASPAIAALLFLGSRSSSSQVLGLPKSCLHAAAGLGPQQAAGSRQRQEPRCYMLQSSFPPSLAAAQAATVITDPAGVLPEQQLVVACGSAPRGKLAVVRSGCGLLPFLLDGPQLPVMLPGLQQDQSSLLMSGLPGGWLLQASHSQNAYRHLLLLALLALVSVLVVALVGVVVVVVVVVVVALVVVEVTAAGVFVIGRQPEGSLQTHWAPEGEAPEQQVAAAELQQQASALALLQVSGGQLLVAAGLWVDNTVLLLTWLGSASQTSAPATKHSQPEPLPVVASVQLGERQARSIAVLPVGGVDVLLVGTNTGSILLWDLLGQQEQHEPGSTRKPFLSWTLHHARSVQVGNTSVSLGPLWLTGDGLGRGAAEASCTSDGFKADHQGRIAFAGISRLCGSEGCQAAAAFSSPDMPQSLAWVSGQGRLCFGGVEEQHKLRWRSRGLPGTPLALAWHQATHTLVVLVQGGARQGDWQQQQAQQLLLLDAASLQPLLVVGSERGVTLLEVVVDDARLAEQQAIQELLASTARVDNTILSVDLDANPVSVDEPVQEGTGASSPEAVNVQQEPQQQHAQQHFHEPIRRVAVRELSSCPLLSGGVALQLRSTGSTITATESLGSITIIKALQAPGALVQLLPVGADHSGLMALDALPVVAAADSGAETMPAHVQDGGSWPTSEEASVGGPSNNNGSSTGAVSQSQQGSAPYRPSAALAAAGQHQQSAVLAACHPVGLMLLQRDLPAEQQHQVMARRVAERAWESGASGLRGPAALELQQQQLMAAAEQPWLGAGEAAPWAAGVPLPAQQHMIDVVGRGAAAGAGQGAGALGVLPLGPQSAPHLLPSAACAPAPGTSVMCAARLGLHVQRLGQHSSSTKSSSCSESLVSSDDSCSSSGSCWQPVWCLSPTGGVSVANLLRPQDLQVLLQLQRMLEQQQEMRQQACMLLPVGKQAPKDSCSWLLRRLEKLRPSAKYSCYHQDHRQWQEDDGEEDSSFPENCVDGDSLHALVEDVLHCSPALLPGLLRMHLLDLESS